MSKKNLGKLGENIALKYYQKNGYQLLAKNFFTRYGEIDLLLKKDHYYLAVEVKTRTNKKFGDAEECINHHKIQKMLTACFIYQPQVEWHLELLVINIYRKKAQLKKYTLEDH